MSLILKKLMKKILDLIEGEELRNHLIAYKMLVDLISLFKL